MHNIVMIKKNEKIMKVVGLDIFGIGFEYIDVFEGIYNVPFEWFEYNNPYKHEGKWVVLS